MVTLHSRYGTRQKYESSSILVSKRHVVTFLITPVGANEPVPDSTFGSNG